MRRRTSKSSNPGLQSAICMHPDGVSCPLCGEKPTVRRGPRFSSRGFRVARISCVSSNDPQMPMLRLSGGWLAKAGFEAGQVIEIDVQQGKLTIMTSAEAAEEKPAVG